MLREAFRPKGPLHDAIRVDRIGLFFLDRGRPTRQIRWKDLNKSPDAGSDISAKSIGGGRAHQYALQVWVASDQGARPELLYFQGTRRFNKVFANAGDLRAHFLAGVKRFRPELEIEPYVDDHFYIDATTGRYDRRARIVSNTVSLSVVAAVILTIVFLVQSG